MEIRSQSVIRHPRDVVYLAYRDELQRIAQDHMPDIKELRVLSREESEGVVKLHNEWHSSAELPRVAKKIIKPEMLIWDDFATWVDDGHYVDWELKLKVFTQSMHCSGRNYFEGAGPGATRIRVTGDLDIDLSEMPGVPRLVARRIAPTIEKFVIGMVTPNITKGNEALQGYLDRK